MTEPDQPRPKGTYVPSSRLPDPPGKSVPPAPATPPRQPPAPQLSGCGKGCLIWALIPPAGIVLVLLILILAPKHDSNAYPAQAQLQCRTFVKEALKSPSSAHFSDEQVTGSGQVWTVTGGVDSDNSFGASIRNSYSCTVQVDPNDSDNWTLESLTGLDS